MKLVFFDNKRLISWLGSAAALLLILPVLFVGQVNAANPDNKDDPVAVQCRKFLNEHAKGAIKACDDEDLITKARKTASYHCVDKPVQDSKGNNQKAACIEGKANDFIGAAARRSPEPRSANGFTLRLTQDLTEDAKRTGGDIDQWADQDSRPPATLCPPGQLDCVQDPAACAANPALEGCPDVSKTCSSNGCDLIEKYVNPSIAVLSGLFSLIAVASLILGGIQYSASAGDPQKVTDAKQRIGKTIIAMVAFALLFSFIQFLIPGGIFNR